MFLIYINDIAANFDNSTCIRRFADDCLLCRVIESPYDNEVLQKRPHISIYEWSCKWRMSFNISKCKTLRITVLHNNKTQPNCVFKHDLDTHFPY